MNKKELLRLGVPRGEVLELLTTALRELARQGLKKRRIRTTVESFVESPATFCEDPCLREAAKVWLAEKDVRASFRAGQATYKQWGHNLEPGAVAQMDQACKLPVALRGALMPDAHLGYGLPIGGVLATSQSIIPYAVGMDIACRMRMTVLDLPVNTLKSQPERLQSALETETRFGVGAAFQTKRRSHPVMDEDWSVSPITQRQRDKAWAQLGTSGSGNHFVEFGALSLKTPQLGLEPGTYLALLSHSGSRGTGGEIARHYSSLAMGLHPELPKALLHLAWLDLKRAEGQEYWQAMELMGRYAAANHQQIHHHVCRHLGGKAIATLENHHNFAWKEIHYGREMIVHRKGATPAGPDAVGIIPGSMATPGYVIRGKGNAESLHSASHGAGRRMSRKAAKQQFNWHAAREMLEERGVTLLSAGLDEVPMAYKDIEEVMAAQTDLVEVLAKFEPRMVKMASGQERRRG